jgi:hypothetical protein
MPLPTCLVAIVLLLDTSGSVSDAHYAAQREGTAAAFEHPQVVRTVEATRGIAVLVAEFSVTATTRVGWTLVSDAASARHLAQTIRAVPRREGHQLTAIGTAIEHARTELDAVPCSPQRRVVDISTDGYETERERPAEFARAAAAADGIEINALAFNSWDPPGAEASQPGEVADVEAWLRSHVATGFVRVVTGPEGYATAFRGKLVTEIASADVAGGAGPAAR